MHARISFHIKLFLSLIIFFSLLLMLIGIYYYYDQDKQLYAELGARAQVQAREIAIFPSLIDAVHRHNINDIKHLMDKLARRSDASYIVIGDRNGIHLYHSRYPEQVGKSMVGGDNSEVLAGKTIISIRRGGLGISLRSKAPIIDAENNIIGIVSIGYLKSHIDHLSAGILLNIIAMALLLLLALFIFSWWFSNTMKKQMFSLEPREIGLLVRKQKALLEAIFEGVIAIDKDYCIAEVNHAAKSLLSLKETSRQLRGRLLAEVIKPIPFLEQQTMLARDTHDEMCVFNHVTVIASRVRIMLEDTLQGWVISFRDQRDIDSLNNQLSQVKRYADNLRILRHEQLNWTATLAGLLHMKRYPEAIQYIEAQSESAQEILDFVSARFCSPTLCGLLLGKYSSAREKGVEILFDPACQLTQIPSRLRKTELMSIIGNLLDNAIEATLQRDGERYPIEVYIVGGRGDLVIEITDQGIGVADGDYERLFTQGVTTKTHGDHGLGLHLVASYVDHAGGAVEVSANQPYGTVFSVFIPMSDPLSPGSSTADGPTYAS
ncbi:sensor histidine kinase [Acerihabitans sp. TG2]|uniref:sensor histidine kinase n=1 Tax=Acerihabitans sp. TG2 TaxID=3096008 RepID=UPI002B2375EF|nr:sensor histidine kinase [Acerihabitans sp. TG2]MEA9391929.1 sensor histidine kinase [Acerihabitans sp. TG2]